MAIIQLYCVEKGASIKPRVIKTDVVEWFLGDARSMVGGATNKLRAKAANAADRKAGAFNRDRHGVLGTTNPERTVCSSANKTDSTLEQLEIMYFPSNNHISSIK